VICFGAAALIGVPLFFLVKAKNINNTLRKKTSEARRSEK